MSTQVQPKSPQVINTVGAFNLRATLNCDAFATEHSSTAHYDVRSFVGLAVCPEAQIGIDAPAAHCCTFSFAFAVASGGRAHLLR